MGLTLGFGAVRRHLERIFWRYAEAVEEDQRHSLQAVLVGLLRRPSPYVSEVARTATGLGPTLEAREQKLLRFLGSRRWELSHLKDAHREYVRTLLPSRGRIRLFADLSDLSKPYARTMDALDWVRDGSDPDKRLQRGYWLNEIYVELPGGRVVPVVFDLFSLRDGKTHSQNEVVLEGIESAFALSGSRGVLIADRGYDNGHVFEALLPQKRHFIIRLQAGPTSRLLWTQWGGKERVEDLVARLPRPFRIGEDEEDRPKGELGWRPVRLPDYPEDPLTLLVLKDRAHEPMALLTSLPVRSPREGCEVVKSYLTRWSGAEDPIRFVKQSFRLEKFLLSTLRAMKAWVFLIGVAMALVGAMLGERRLRRPLLVREEHFRERVDFLYYRAARALASLLALQPSVALNSLVMTSGP